MKNKNIIFVIVTIVIVAGARGAGLIVGGGSTDAQDNQSSSPAVSVVDNKQIIDISAKGGYSPRNIQARANLPTVLRISTNNTFDCSASLVIPKLGYQNFLESTGVEEIVLNSDQAKGTLQGLCGMGMYGFKVNFN